MLSKAKPDANAMAKKLVVVVAVVVDYYKIVFAYAAVDAVPIRIAPVPDEVVAGVDAVPFRTTTLSDEVAAVVVPIR